MPNVEQVATVTAFQRTRLRVQVALARGVAAATRPMIKGCPGMEKPTVAEKSTIDPPISRPGVARLLLTDPE